MTSLDRCLAGRQVAQAAFLSWRHTTCTARLWAWGLPIESNAAQWAADACSCTELAQSGGTIATPGTASGQPPWCVPVSRSPWMRTSYCNSAATAAWFNLNCCSNNTLNQDTHTLSLFSKCHWHPVEPPPMPQLLDHPTNLWVKTLTPW